MSKPQVVALDIGSRRIGVAVSDPIGVIAQARDAIVVNGVDFESAADQIGAVVAERGAEVLVVGLPLTMKGTEGAAVRRMRKFCGLVMARLPDGTELVEWDERFTTVAADRMLMGAGLDAKKRRKVVDSVAATMILQGFLDQRSR